MNEAKTDEIDALGRAEKAEARARRACQRLVEVVGASGPCSVEDAAERAAKRIRELEAEVDRLRGVCLMADVDRARARAEKVEAERDEWAARVAAVTDALHRIEGEYGCQCSPPCPSDGDEACVSAIAGDALRHFGGRAEALLRERDAMRVQLERTIQVAEDACGGAVGCSLFTDLAALEATRD